MEHRDGTPAEPAAIAALPIDRLPIWFQRAENALIAVAVVALFVARDFDWWWLLVLFLAFDLSMAGYARNPRLGAWMYDAVHSYVGPAALAMVAVVGDVRWAEFLALVWAFHIAVDRTFGYGLKFIDRFSHTHLGEIGRPSAPR
ncbi:MAG: DUF4260 domain-containing protein [Jiangellaceae bacterium]